MAERNVSVKLSARVDAYVAAMTRARNATGMFGAETQRNMRMVGGQMQSFGRSASLYVTAPLVGMAGAAVSMAASFDRSMSLITGLVGVSAREVDAMRESVLALAGETGRAPQELAEALYFITSSGFDGAEALDVLEASAKAAASGLGDSAVIADLLTSAMNAYGHDALSAATATDILTEAVRLGKGEPDEFAASMGRVLPMASELGVEFHEVAAAFAAMSLTGTNAEESATQLGAIMNGLISPSAQAREALAGVGLSMDDVLASMRDNGLLPTLQMLADKLGGNATATEAVFENVRALRGVLSMLGANGEQTAAIFADMTDSTGASAAAFASWEQTAGARMSKAFANIKAAMIEVGAILLPIVASVAGALGSMAGWFADLSTPIQAVALGFAALAASAGPVIFIAGSLIKNLREIKAALAVVGPSAAKAGLALGALGVAAMAGFMVYQSFTRESRELSARTDELAQALGAEIPAVEELAEAAKTAAAGVNELTEADMRLGDALANTGEDGEKIRAAFGALRLDISELVFWMDALEGDDAVRGSAFEEMGRQAGVAEEYLTALADAVMETDGNAGLLADSLADNLQESLNMSREDALALAAELLPVAQAMEELDDQAEKFDGNAVTREYLLMAAGSSELANNLIILAETQTGLTRNGEHTRSIMAKLLEIIEGFPPEAQAAARAALGLGEAEGELADAADGAVEATTELLKIAGHTQTALKDLGDVFVVVGKNAGHLDSRLKAAGDALTNLDVKEASDGMDELSEATDGLAERELPSLEDALDGVADRTLDAAEAADVLSDAFTRALGPHGNSMRVTDEVNQGWVDFAENVDASSDALDQNSDAGLQNRGVVLDAADDLKSLIQARIEEGWAVEDINAEYQRNREHLLDVAEAAGLNRDQVEELIEEYGLVPELVTTTVAVAGRAFAEWQIARFRARLDALPEREQTNIAAMVDRGQLAQAEAYLNYLARVRETKIRVSVVANYSQNLADLMARRAEGGYQDRPEIALWGEAGPEVMFPLTDPHRIRQLWSDPRVAGPMMDALGGHMTPGSAHVSPMLSGGGSSGGSSGPSISVGELHVGDRHDLAAVHDAFDDLAWKVSKR